MGRYEQIVVPRLVELTLGRSGFGPLRARAAEGLEGEVLELGFGSGLNLTHYPTAVTRVLAVDPSRVGARMAAPRISAAPMEVEIIGLDGQDLPLADASVDHALATWTLCTIPDAVAALREVRRVLRPGGRFHFLEHGRSDDPKVVRWQERLTPVQRRVAGGCHLDRRIDALVSEAGFEIEDLTRFQVAGPRSFTHMYAGRTAPKPAPSHD